MMIGKYEILGELGEGGMGKVLLGYDTLLDCKVAIKAVRADAIDSDIREELEGRLLQEARAAAKLDHPGIVSIREFLREGNSGYIVMKFVKGKTLDHAAPLSNPTDPAFVLRVLRECAAALDHAHARNIVHRDIKPGNIMIDDETGAVQITDFGIAKILDGEQRTEPGMVIGTYEYMAPERLSPSSAAKVDGRTDQFSLAILAQRMLTGAPVYSSNTLRSLSYEIVHEEPPSAHAGNAALPAEVDPVLAKALAKDPSRRYPTCIAFVEALEAAFGYEVPARVDTGRGRTEPGRHVSPPRTWLPSRRSLLAAAVIAAPIVLIAAAVYYFSTPSPPSSSSSSSKKTAGTIATTLPDSLTMPAGNMVLVKGGEALLGPDRKPVPLESFYIDRTEVTNEAYLAFCSATGHPVARDAERSPAGDPVVNVSFDDAQAFAQWAGKRLPTAAEWEKAARGSTGQAYPWGNDWRDNAANIPADSKTKLRLESADSFPSGASEYGALNMIGNVWEWVATSDQPDDTAFQLLRGDARFKGSKPPLSRTEPAYQTRGGSFKYFAADRSAFLFDGLVIPARLFMDDLGFRCAKDP
jgi:serine/threonine protein kinase